MTGPGGPGSTGSTGSTELLERAISYALGTVRPVTPELLHQPTPCQGWDLRMLLRHLNESLAALLEGVGTGAIALGPGPEDGRAADDPAEAFRLRATGLLAAWANDGCAGGAGGSDRTGRLITVAGCPLTAGAVTSAGALEIAVHGWDIARSSGQRRPVPRGLATELLGLCPLLVPPSNARSPLFAPAVALPSSAGPSDRLVAFLGRDPG
ncbi:TIGR03086 family metal-binding protein [Streptomyces gobiensis]|uniref:TIGR03086 family metal-binding protein n=1 Tax=Streptomyces gobiensis TaxID=2875706 RepID=UPI001E62F512|nr:TIGR03086 family metal-binding protein [Streptomyces gobiensis]UGY91794.1 TIGR03086 family protein [Streptomyces gobiensis]